MSRFLRALIQFVLEYVVLPVVIFLGIVLLGTAPLVATVLFVLVAIIWSWRLRRARANERNTSTSPKSSSNTKGKPSFSRNQTPRPRRAAAFHQPSTHHTRRRGSGPRNANGPSRKHQESADQTSDFSRINPDEEHEWARHHHFEHEPFAHEPHHAREPEPRDFSRSYGMAWSSPFGNNSLMRDPDLGSSPMRDDELGAWIRGDPPFDHDRNSPPPPS